MISNNFSVFSKDKKSQVKVSGPTTAMKGETRLRSLFPMERKNSLRGKDLESQVDAMT